MPNLHELIEQEAKTNLEDIKEVPPIPVGSYLSQIVGNYENVTSTRKQTAGIQFTVRLISAMEDVGIRVYRPKDQRKASKRRQ